MNDESADISLTQDELMRLFHALAIPTEEALQSLAVWAERTRFDQEFLEMVLDGTLMVVGWKGGEPLFTLRAAEEQWDAVAEAERIIEGDHQQEGP